MFDLYRKQPHLQTRWASFENLNGEKGMAARENRGGKGHPCEAIVPGQTKTLLDIEGCGTITRMWLTLSDRSPKMLRSLRIDMYWDGSDEPAVSAPFGDFFGMGLSRIMRLDCELFSSPEAASFNCFIPMPFRTGARITVTYEGDGETPMIFYDVDYLLSDKHADDILYFHATWRRENQTTPGQDFVILPQVRGDGRFIGCNVGVTADARYEDSWWGEGEVKVYLDGDTNHPTLCGTGTEDYIGTGWGQKVYVTRYQGCTIADPVRRQWAFYRYHIPDPVFFHSDCSVAIQQIGGANRTKVVQLQKENGAALIPVTLASGVNHGYTKLLEQDPSPSMDDPELPDLWCNYYRSDDVSAAAYFYLDAPTNGLPPLAGVEERTADLPELDETARGDQ